MANFLKRVMSFSNLAEAPVPPIPEDEDTLVNMSDPEEPESEHEEPESENEEPIPNFAEAGITDPTTISYE